MYVCVCMYICMYVYVYMYVCMYMYGCMDGCMDVHMYVCVYVYAYMYVLCTYVCVYVHMYVCMYVCTYVCMHVCIHIYKLYIMYGIKIKGPVVAILGRMGSGGGGGCLANVLFLSVVKSCFGTCCFENSLHTYHIDDMQLAATKSVPRVILNYLSINLQYLEYITETHELLSAFNFIWKDIMLSNTKQSTLQRLWDMLEPCTIDYDTLYNFKVCLKKEIDILSLYLKTYCNLYCRFDFELSTNSYTCNPSLEDQGKP